MTLDLLDAAFVRRWETKPRGLVATSLCEPREDPPRVPTADAAAPATPVDALVRVSPAALAEPGALAEPAALAGTGAKFSVGEPADAGIVQRLLAAASHQWQSLADRLEAARLRGHRVIAIAGGAPGEGRSTLVDCLAAVLRARGRDVLRLGPADVAARSGPGPTHDKRIVLVDAGIWFPPGPIRRSRLLAVSQGCDAAILVRRGDAAAAAAWEAALAAIGIEVLGEVLTFVPDAFDPGIDSSSSLGPL